MVDVAHELPGLCLNIDWTRSDELSVRRENRSPHCGMFLMGRLNCRSWPERSTIEKSLNEGSKGATRGLAIKRVEWPIISDNTDGMDTGSCKPEMHGTKIRHIEV